VPISVKRASPKTVETGATIEFGDLRVVLAHPIDEARNLKIAPHPLREALERRLGTAIKLAQTA
jgi:hypothetical protein